VVQIPRLPIPAPPPWKSVPKAVFSTTGDTGSTGRNELQNPVPPVSPVVSPPSHPPTGAWHIAPGRIARKRPQIRVSKTFFLCSHTFFAKNPKTPLLAGEGRDCAASKVPENMAKYLSTSSARKTAPETLPERRADLIAARPALPAPAASASRKPASAPTEGGRRLTGAGSGPTESGTGLMERGAGLTEHGAGLRDCEICGSEGGCRRSARHESEPPKAHHSEWRWRAKVGMARRSAPSTGRFRLISQSLTERGAGLAERGAGLTERGAGLTERGAGLTEHGAGLTEHGAGLTEHGAGLTERGTGLTERGAGPTECGTDLNPGERKSLSAKTGHMNAKPCPIPGRKHVTPDQSPASPL